MSKSKMVYRYGNGPNAIELGSRIFGRQPEELVEEASDPTSILHPYFEWDDTVAAHEHRLTTARLMIRSVQRIPPGEIERAMLHVPSRQAYVPTEVVLADPALRHEFIAAAERELFSWVKKYGSVPELAAYVAAIESAPHLEKAA